MLAHILHEDGIAQIGFVRAVFCYGLVIGDERELRRYRLAFAELLEQPAQHRLHGLEHVLLRDEAHLDIELVKFTGRAVGARILVAKAGRDLEVAVEARDHDELFELLRRLRQRVEFPGVHPRRYEEVARSFWRRGRQDRCLKFEEVLAVMRRRMDETIAERFMMLRWIVSRLRSRKRYFSRIPPGSPARRKRAAAIHRPSTALRAHRSAPRLRPLADSRSPCRLHG